MFTFSDLKQFTRVAKTSVEDIASELGLSYDGVKSGLDNQALKIRFVVPLCKILNITPNQFFGVDGTSGDTNYGNMQKNAKKQVMQIAGTEELKRTIEILNAQLEEKDKQIAKLIEKL